MTEESALGLYIIFHILLVENQPNCHLLGLLEHPFDIFETFAQNIPLCFRQRDALSRQEFAIFLIEVAYVYVRLAPERVHRYDPVFALLQFPGRLTIEAIFSTMHTFVDARIRAAAAGFQQFSRSVRFDVLLLCGNGGLVLLMARDNCKFG